MQLQDKVVVVTGGANGIGRALCRRFSDEGAAAVVVTDIDEAAAMTLAEEIGGLGLGCDVGIEAEIQHVVNRTQEEHGRIDLFCSNAGITVNGGLETTDAQWQQMWQVNVLSRVYAARAVLPSMLARGSGYFLQTVSAAGLLTEIGSASYSVTKHADLAYAEWLSSIYGREGIGVSCICPLGVETDMLDPDDPIHQFLQVAAITPEQVADSVIDGLNEERFLILPHPEVADFFQIKAGDHDRWLRGMQRLHQKLTKKRSRKAA
jgi:NAD(P)-dependent dehydrogenase (short-subunit alcohol dehydrogenase family)